MLRAVAAAVVLGVMAALASQGIYRIAAAPNGAYRLNVLTGEVCFLDGGAADRQLDERLGGVSSVERLQALVDDEGFRSLAPEAKAKKLAGKFNEFHQLLPADRMRVVEALDEKILELYGPSPTDVPTSVAEVAFHFCAR